MGLEAKEVELIKRYDPELQIVRRLGQGGFGQVYQCEKTVSGKTERSALKVVSWRMSEKEKRNALENHRKETADRDQMLERALGEIRTVQKLKCKQVVQHLDEPTVFKYDPPDTGFDLFIKMELLQELEKKTDDEARKDDNSVKATSFASEVGIDICEALKECAKHNIIHRDIKPENIFYRESDHTYCLGDFGIAREYSGSAQSLTPVGTDAYAAPEVLQGRRYSAQADIYSLGLVLYRLVNHKRAPFLPSVKKKPNLEINDENEAKERRLRGDVMPPPENCTPGFARIVLKMCAFRPEERFQRIGDVIEAMQIGDLPEARNAAAAAMNVSQGNDVDPNATTYFDVRKNQSPLDRVKQLADGVQKQVDVAKGAQAARGNAGQPSAQGLGNILKYAVIIALVAIVIFLSVRMLRAIGSLLFPARSSVGTQTAAQDDEISDATDLDETEALLAAAQGGFLPLIQVPATGDGSFKESARTALGGTLENVLRLYKYSTRATAQFTLDGRYDRLTATAFCGEETSDNTEFLVEIYTDDDYVHPAWAHNFFKADMETPAIDLDVSNTRTLYIVARSGDDKIKDVLFADAVLHVKETETNEARLASSVVPLADGIHIVESPYAEFVKPQTTALGKTVGGRHNKDVLRIGETYYGYEDAHATFAFGAGTSDNFADGCVRFTGTVACGEDSPDGKVTPLQIILDNDEANAQVIPVSKGMSEVELDVDLTGVKRLTFQMIAQDDKDEAKKVKALIYDGAFYTAGWGE